MLVLLLKARVGFYSGTSKHGSFECSSAPLWLVLVMVMVVGVVVVMLAVLVVVVVVMVAVLAVVAW